MSAEFGVDSMAGQLRRVAMRAPGAILTSDAAKWHYARPIDVDSLEREHRQLAELIESHGAKVLWLPNGDDELADSIFTYDPSFMTPAGAIVMRPGKELRLGEVELHERFYEANDVPVIGLVRGTGHDRGRRLLLARLDDDRRRAGI